MPDMFQTLPTSVKIRWDHKNRELWVNDRFLSPRLSISIKNLSPNGFNVGGGGPGMAQAALAILLEFLPKIESVVYYQDFKWQVIATWPAKDFQIYLNLKEEMIKIVRKNSILR